MAENQIKTNQKLPMSSMAITSLVIGILALITSFIPIINNGSFFIALIGAVFGVVGIVGIFKGKKRSKVFGIIALIVNILAMIIVLATQSMWSDSLNNVAGNPAKSTKGASEAKVGESLTLSNDLDLTVVSVEGGLTNYDGTAVTKVVVKYVNNGNKEVSYNVYDWKAENSQGAQTSQTIYSSGGLTGNSENLNSGKLSAGGTVSGTIYFKGDVKKMLYSSSLLNDTTATWIV